MAHEGHEATVRRRRLLGRELRTARIQAGMTQAAAAKVLDCGQAKINKIETTPVEVKMADLDGLLAAYRVDATKADQLRLLAAADRFRPRPKSRPRSKAFRELKDLERDAREILCWHREVIPGPLQSEQYMLTQFNADTKPTCEVVELVRRHADRADIFTIEDPPNYRVILSESALHRMPGGRSPERVLDQVEHLLTAISRHPRLTVQIMTFEARIRFTYDDFVVVRFAESEEDFAYLEDPGEGRTVNKIAPFVEHWEALHAAALSPDDSVKFLDQLAEQTRTEWHTEITNAEQPYAPGE